MPLILNIAIPSPLRRSFDYLPPVDMSANEIEQLQPGIRIKAPFGNRKMVGILLQVKQHSDISQEQLKPVSEILDETPLLSHSLFKLGLWAASYYQHPIGDALASTLPVLLRKGSSLIKNTTTCWRLTTEGKGLPNDGLKRSPKQAQLLKLLLQKNSIDREELTSEGFSVSIVNAMIDKGLVEAFTREAATAKISANNTLIAETPLPLNDEQQSAYQAVIKQKGFNRFLLEGVTGSGKTEVYLQLIAEYLQRGLQALVLVPEIGLTPQTVNRFQRRFNCQIAILHSGMTDRERLLNWQAAKDGEAHIIIGTRSAVFTPLLKPGLIIIDEEHDSSFKQQDGFRYSARDVAIKRALDEQCPIILGSATPSLETLHNVVQTRYHYLQLTQRATGAQPPTFELLDIRHQPMEEGFSPALIKAINAEVSKGNQVLVFINRRGFAPILLCHDCGHISTCQHCDARMTVHLSKQQLRCHHCDYQKPLPNTCPECNSHQLDFRGVGTERSEQVLQRLFPTVPVHRIDRDTTSRKQAMQNLIDEIHRGDACILVGTQMLAKGHHFPNVTLVAVLDADSGLFSTDFRGPERMGQLLIQVAGRAGRANKAGKVLIQTHQPDHPLIIRLFNDNYTNYAKDLLKERQTSTMPPFSHLAIIRADANQLEIAEQFLLDIKTNCNHDKEKLLGPLPAPMARRAGRFRAQLIVRSQQRNILHSLLASIIQLAEAHPSSKKVRWSVDVDPQEMF